MCANTEMRGSYIDSPGPEYNVKVQEKAEQPKTTNYCVNQKWLFKQLNAFQKMVSEMALTIKSKP